MRSFALSESVLGSHFLPLPRHSLPLSYNCRSSCLLRRREWNDGTIDSFSPTACGHTDGQKTRQVGFSKEYECRVMNELLKKRTSLERKCFLTESLSTSMASISNLHKFSALFGFLALQGSEPAIAGSDIASGLQSLPFLGDLGDISTGFLAHLFFGARFGGTDLPVDDIAAVCLLAYFGVSTLLDATSSGSPKSEDEQKEAELAVSKFSGNDAGILAAANTIISTFILVFVAEWGDKSFFSTIALAAASSPLGVIGGALAGHGVATLLAVLGGSLLGTFLSEKLKGTIIVVRGRPVAPLKRCGIHARQSSSLEVFRHNTSSGSKKPIDSESIRTSSPSSIALFESTNQTLCQEGLRTGLRSSSSGIVEAPPEYCSCASHIPVIDCRFKVHAFLDHGLEWF
ncbi:hypothetical protein SAY87_012364 [Trapa incisa]|uniref:GDT1 family protein n=1 Tax=Trapa incisa TaxID=236973 RepID=A0AAN7H110_9MYRT|nr:hypothetical protein SAY87_012364 [Trapa incisa]